MDSWLNSMYSVKLLYRFVILFCFAVSGQMIGISHLAWAEPSSKEFEFPSPPADPDDTEIVIRGNYDIVDKCINNVIRRIKYSENSEYGKLAISGHPLVTRSRKFGIVFRLDFVHPFSADGDVFRFICWSAPPAPPYKILVKVGFMRGKSLREFR